jgi:hypothetical protein
LGAAQKFMKNTGFALYWQSLTAIEKIVEPAAKADCHQTFIGPAYAWRQS